MVELHRIKRSLYQLMQGGFTDALMRNHHFSTSFSRNTFRSIYSKWCKGAYQITRQTRLWITATKHYRLLYK